MTNIRFAPSSRYPNDYEQREHIVHALLNMPSVHVQRAYQYEYQELRRILQSRSHPDDHVVVTSGLHEEYGSNGIRLHFDVALQSRHYTHSRICHVYVDVFHEPHMKNTHIAGVERTPNGSVVLHPCSYQPRLRILDFTAF